MSDLEKAARMALKTLEYIDLQDHDRDFLSYKECHDLDEAITVLRQALSNNVEQPAQQEPFKPDWVNYRQGVEDGRAEALEMLAKQEPVAFADGTFNHAPLPFGTPLYAAPQPSKPWVGLTWDDMPDSSCDDPAFLAGAQWANSKLKEKNT